MAEFDSKKHTSSLKLDNTYLLDKDDENKMNTDKNQELSAEIKKISSKTNKSPAKPNKKDKKPDTSEVILKNPVANPIWLSISEASKLGGVNTKTIRRAIQSEKIKYKIYKNRYLIGLKSLILYLNTNTKLKNKLNFNGIGQYIKGWRK